MPPPKKARKAALRRRRNANGDFAKEDPVISEIIIEEQVENPSTAVTETDVENPSLAVTETDEVMIEVRGWVLESYTNDKVVSAPLQVETTVDVINFPSKEHNEQVDEWKDVIVWKAEKQSSRGPYLNNSTATKWRKRVDQQKALKDNYSIANYFSINP